MFLMIEALLSSQEHLNDYARPLLLKVECSNLVKAPIEDSLYHIQDGIATSLSLMRRTNIYGIFS